MADLFELCHRRSALAALVVADVSDDVLDAVRKRYNSGRRSPMETRLVIQRAPELLSAPDHPVTDMNVRTYVREHFALVPTSPIIPCFYILIDERTARDGTVLFVQQDFADSPDDRLRTMPQHVPTLYCDLVMGDDDWERCHEEWHNDDDVYDPQFDYPSFSWIQSVVGFPASFARLRTESGENSKDERVFELDPEAALQLGLSLGDSPKLIRQSSRDDGTFGEHLFLEVYAKQVNSVVSDQLRVWDTSDFFDWRIVDQPNSSQDTLVDDRL